jgi:hypothetical protein
MSALELVDLAETAYPGKCDLSDDALAYSGSAIWENWRCHVPVGIVGSWARLDPTTRAAVFLTAIAATHWEGPSPSRPMPSAEISS